MRFVSERPMKLVQMRNVNSKAGNPLTFIKIADPATFDSNEFLLSSDTQVALEVMKDYLVALVVDGRYTNALLMPLPLSK